MPLNQFRQSWPLLLSTAIAATVITGAVIPEQAHAQFTPISRSDNQCSAQLTQRVNQVISQPQFAGARWGIVVESLATGEILYQHNADQYFIPASNIKLLTTVTALERVANLNQYSSSFVSQIQQINRDSNNAIADRLFRDLGGQAEVQTTLLNLGLDPYGVRQVDGSGLSRYNMVRPDTLVGLLRYMWQGDRTQLFYQSLPVAGSSGTLRNRFHGTSAYGRIRAKTGTLRGVRALSGYAETADREPLVFSILINDRLDQSGTMMIDGIDAIAVGLTQLRSCL